MAEAKWLEISLTVDGELAEAVASVMDAYVSNGVVVESGVNFYDDEDEGTPYGPVKVYGYLIVDEHLEETRRRLEEALWHLGQIQPLPEASYRPVMDEDWMAAWKQHYKPIPVGKKLLILPAWVDLQDPNRLPVRIDPSMAFGTGTHPTTQLVMELQEELTPPGVQVIDIGCGSGILSIAAIRLGAAHALGVDIDPASVKATRENAAANDVAEQIEVGLGSVDEVLAGQFSLRSAPLVLANILAPVIIRLFDGGLGSLVQPGGALILSGILEEQAAGVQQAAEAKGFTFINKKQLGDWVALAFRAAA
mgnify:CR=1 FL=1